MKHEKYLEDAEFKMQRARRLLEYSITASNAGQLQCLAEDEFLGAVELYKKAREVYPQYLMEFGISI